MEQFGSLCSGSRRSHCGAHFSPGFLLGGAPLCRRHRHKYLFSPEHFPSPRLTFFLSAAPPPPPIPFSLWRLLFVFPSHSLLSFPAPARSYLVPRLSLSLYLSPPFFRCQIPPVASFLWFLTEPVFTHTPRPPVILNHAFHSPLFILL